MFKEDVVYSTTNYDIFAKVAGNREVTANHLKMISKSFNKEIVPIPIVVNEKMEIIDGQHRFEELMRRKLPIRFIVIPGTGIKQVNVVNSAAKKWTSKDHAKSYAQQGNTNYIRFLTFCELYPHLSTTTLAVDIIKRDFKSHENQLVNGTFTVSDFEYSRAIDFAKLMRDFESYIPPKSKSVLFYKAIARIMMHPEYDHARMMRKLSYQSDKITKEVYMQSYFGQFTDVYNHHLGRTEKFVDFKHDLQPHLERRYWG